MVELSYTIHLCDKYLYSREGCFFMSEGLLTDKQTEEVIRFLKEKTLTKAFKLGLNSDRKPSIFDSKVGGIPYFPSNMDIPKNSEGYSLTLLAQLNMADFEGSDILPQKGMLQFYISGDDLYGADFDNPCSSESSRVIYHSEINKSITEKEVAERFSKVKEKCDEEFFPHEGEFAIDVTPQETFIGPEDYRFEKIFTEALKIVGIDEKEIEENGFFEYIDYDNKEFRIGQGHWVLGYPFFTQYDPRDNNAEYEKFDTLLFQLDSESDKPESGKWKVLWGDCGVGNFFINSDDLKKLDFSNVMYNWDCC